MLDIFVALPVIIAVGLGVVAAIMDLGTIQGTKIERYERTVSQVVLKDVTAEHVFEIGDWGGEHIVDAQQELIVDEIHGLLIVVDLGGKDAKAVEPARIQEQLR